MIICKVPKISTQWSTYLFHAGQKWSTHLFTAGWILFSELESQAIDEKRGGGGEEQNYGDGAELQWDWLSYRLWSVKIYQTHVNEVWTPQWYNKLEGREYVNSTKGA